MLGLISCSILGLEGGSFVLFLFFEVFAFLSSFDVYVLPLIKDGFLVSVLNIRPVWVKLTKYCATCSRDAALWRFLAMSANVIDFS